MKRNVLAGLVATAVLGTAGGTFAAVQLTGDRTEPTASAQDPGSTEAASPAEEPSQDGATEDAPSTTDGPSQQPTEDPTQEPSTSGSGPAVPSTDVLWTTTSVLHDGPKEIHLSGVSGEPMSVQRLADGYLLAFADRPDAWGNPLQALYVVTEEDPYSDNVIFVRGSWDVDPSGTRLIGWDHDAREYGIWDLDSMKRTETVQRPDGVQHPQRAIAGFAGTDGDVVTGWKKDGQAFNWVTDLRSGDGGPALEGVSDWAISDDGSTFLGNTTDPDPKSEAGVCATGGTFISAGDGAEPWLNCDSRFYNRAEYSPGETEGLAVPAMTDGFGPGALDRLDTATGERIGQLDLFKGVAKKYPTRVAHYASDDLIALNAAFDVDGDGTVVLLCTLDGSCRKEASTEGVSALASAHG